MRNFFTHTRMRKSPSLEKQTGFTLIELMIASALGIGLIGGMYTLFTVNKESVRVLSNVSLAQQKANFALNIMAEDVKMAGWPGVFDPSATDPFGDRRNNTYQQFAEGTRYDTFVVSRLGRAAIPGDPDPLLAQNELDCVGNPIVPGQPLVHRYFVNAATKELICQSLPSGQQQTIIGNVEGFKVMYGVDTQSGPCASVAPGTSPRDAAAECMRPTLYTGAAGLANALITATAAFNEASQLRPVKTIRFAIAVSTEETDIIDRALGISKTHFHLMNQHYANAYEGSLFNEGRAVRVSERTVGLRQAMRGP